MDISAWWNARAFLDDVRPYINQVAGRRWMAFSMPDGLVYVQPKALEQIARMHAARAGAMKIAAMPAEDPAMRQVLIAVVEKLRREVANCIAIELIREGFFGGNFIITTTETGLEYKGYYTPFHAEAFGGRESLERDKPDFFRKFRKVRIRWKRRRKQCLNP